jgi:hypothetical protein
MKGGRSFFPMVRKVIFPSFFSDGCSYFIAERENEPGTVQAKMNRKNSKAEARNSKPIQIL